MPVLIDRVLGFSVGGGAARGRVARLGPALDVFLGPYPKPVARLLAETGALAVVLAAGLKYDGVFSLQAQGKGPVSLVVADVTSAGHLRLHARFDSQRLAMLGKTPSTKALLAAGYLAFTVDQGPDTERYQGIVELSGESLEDAARTYLKQSEQLDSAILAAVAEPEGDRGWTAAAAMVQRMPSGSAGAPILMAEDSEECWRRAEIMMGSLKDSEMLDRELTLDRLLHRLYHADQLQVFSAKTVEGRCRCSTERVKATLASLPREDLDSLADSEGKIVVTCEFCHAAHAVPLSELA